MRDFLFGHTRVWTRDLWISSPAPYQYATVTSAFQHWQFEVFYSGAEGLVVILFWLDLWQIFFLATLKFEPRTSGSLVLHSTTVPQWHLVFTCDNFRYLTLFWLDLWEIFFLATPAFLTRDLWISSPELYHCATVTSGFHLWQFQVYNSGAEGLVVVLFWLDLWEIWFWPHQGLNQGSLDFQSCTLPLCHSDFWFSPLTISGI